jgi:type II secretory pathway pseudopilin PulG
LIELLVVILIIGILIAVAAPSFLGQTQKAHDSATKQYLTVAYQEAAASATDRAGDFTTTTPVFAAAALATAIQTSEPELTVTATTGTDSCPSVAMGQPDTNIYIDTSATSGNNLVMCSDPNNRVWTLTVTDGALQPFPSEPYTGAPITPPTDSNPVALTVVNQPSGFIYYHDQGDSPTAIYTADANGANPRLVFSVSGGSNPWVDISNAAAGKLIVYTGDDNNMNVGVLSSSGSVVMLTSDGHAGAAKISPDGSKVVFENSSSALFEVSSSGGAVTPLGFSSDNFYWAGNNHLVSYSNADNTLVLYTMDGTVVQQLADFSAGLPELSTTASGNSSFCWLQIDNYDKVNTLGNTIDNDSIYCVNGSNWSAAPVQVLAPGDAVGAGTLSMSPDGSELAYAGADANGDGSFFWMMHSDGSGSPLALGGSGFSPWNWSSWSGPHSVLVASYPPASGIASIPDSGADASQILAGDGTNADYSPVWLGW